MAKLTKNTSGHRWLTHEFLENILKSSEDSQHIQVINFELHEAVPKGENYGSYMIRVTIDYTDDTGPSQKSLVIKTDLDSNEINEKLNTVGLFDKEIAFYRDILPRFKKYTDLIDKDFLCAPRCYATNSNPNYIVFEDLKVQNYRNIDRRIGLDYKATEMVLRKLAKMHAINAMIYEENPELFEPHKTALISRENPEMLAACTNGLRDLNLICPKWLGYEHFVEKFDSLFNDALDIWESTFSVDDTTFNTLIHGDLWANNIMYQFDETSNPVDVRMVDFQIGYYGSPAADLSYIFYTSTVNELVEEDWDRLIHIYHTELVSALQLVKYPTDRIPSLTELQIQMLKKSLVAVIISLSGVALRHLDGSIEPDLNLLLLDDSRQHRLALYDKPAVYERIQYLLNFFDRKGFLDRRL